MRVICPGCGAAFKRSGLSHHFRQSEDPRCHPAIIPVHGPRTMNVDEDEQQDQSRISVDPGPGTTNVDEDGQQDQGHIPVDPLGDLFGDYVDYVGFNFEVDSEGDQDMDDSIMGDDPECPTDAHEDDEAALEEAFLAEEYQLEPERPAGCPDALEQEPEDAPYTPAEHATFRLRGGFERPLSEPPEIVKFGDQNAGAVYKRVHQNGNQDYHRAIGGTEGTNPYAPFSSRLDWEIACWAKMRGPGSNSLTELLRIEGVSLAQSSNFRSDLLIMLIRSLRGLV